MKIYTLLLFVSMTGLFAFDSNGQSITINVEKTELKSVFSEIESKTNFNFFYNNSLIDVSKKVSLKVENQDLKRVLTKLLKKTTIDFRFYKDQIVLFPKNNTSISSMIDEIITKDAAQNRDTLVNTATTASNLESKITIAIQNLITGVVSDESGEPLPGVNILIKGSQKGTQTDFDGKYTIDAKAGDILVFSFIGTKSQEITVGIETTIDVVMQPDNLLDEVVVVAYGTSSKEAITGSVSKIGTADIQKRTVSNISQALEGSTTGVIVTSPSGQPGAGQSIRIRGFGSFGSSNSPLYVVDGIPINGSINSINPNDIESVSILKDAGSTALYGNKAANGVIIVTTKKGRTQGGQFNASVSTSFVSRGTKEYDRLGPSDFYEAYWEAGRNSVAIPGVDSDADVAAASAAASANIFANLLHNPFNVPNDQIVGVDGRINPNAQLQYPEDLDWEDAISRTGIRKNADVSFNSRSEKGGYYASLGYLNEEGYIKNTNFDRITARVNGDIQATDWLKVGINLTGIRSEGNQAQTGSTQSGSTANPFRFTRNIGSIYPIHAHNQTTGAYILDGNGNRTESLIRGAGASNGRHIVFELLNDIDLDERNRLDGKVFVELELAKGLKLTNNASYEVQNFYNTRYRNPVIGDGAPNADASRTYIRTSTEVYNQILSYQTSFNSIHNFDAIAGHESQTRTIVNFSGGADNEIFQGNIELDNFSVPGIPSSDTRDVNEESYFGRFNYNYDSKYFLSASIRTDGTSRIPAANRWGTFWSIGGSWSVHREKFIEDISWIDNLKFRSSYGQLGNANIGTFPYQALLELGNNNQLEAGVVLNSLGNENLVWEKSIHTDVAIEFSMFNRLRGSVEYYNKVSEDLIFDVPLPLSAGGLEFGNSQSQNVGELFNRGIEVSLSYDIIKQEDLAWTMTINASTLRNEVTELPPGQESVTNGTKRLEVGSSLFDYYIKDWYGVDPADGSGLYVAEDPNATGVRTIDGVAVTPFTNNAKLDFLGSVIPDVYGSINSNFRFKSFNFGFLLTYQIGGENLDNGYRDLIHSGTYGASLHSDLLNRWRQPGDITDTPRVDVTLSTQWDDTSDRFLVDASYLSLRQVNASYDIPQFLLNKINATTGKLFVNGENLFNINARKGFNQQQEFSGNTSNVFVPSKLITIGLNVTF